MSAIIPPGFAEAVFVLTISGDAEPMVTTIGLNVSVSGADAGVANAVFDAFADNFLPNMRTTTTLQRVELHVGQDGGDPVIVFSTNAPEAGANSSDGLPQNCALLIKKVSALGGRKNRGRMFIPGALPENAVDQAGVISGGAVAAYQGEATGFFDDLETAVGEFGVVILHSGADDPTTIVQLIVDPVIATQRRRLRK